MCVHVCVCVRACLRACMCVLKVLITIHVKDTHINSALRFFSLFMILVFDKMDRHGLNNRTS